MISTGCITGEGDAARAFFFYGGMRFFLLGDAAPSHIAAAQNEERRGKCQYEDSAMWNTPDENS